MSLWGPRNVAPGRTRFGLWAPDCEAVTLEIDGGGSLAMQAEDDGWIGVEAVAGPGTRYRFRIGADLAVPDPASRGQSGGVHGWSVVPEPSLFRQADEWRGRPWHEAVLYEVHAGSLGGFAGVAERLPALADLGVTAIELMPIAAFGGSRNWGYDGVLPYAPAESYGTPAELKALIERAHGLGLMILLDVVYNHFGPDGNYLDAYANRFFDRGMHTPWGGAIAAGEPAVFDFFLHNALMWLDEYRFDGLRFDAVHAIGNDDFLDRIASEIRGRIASDRHVHLILENERNDAARLAPGLYDAQWNDDFHNVLHVLLTGETSAYYGDFADRPAERLARCLSQGFIYQGESSPSHDGRPRGTPSAHLPPTAFVSFLQNHDQVGNRALGERLTVLTDAERLRTATALLLLCPQIPLLFMGDETGSRSPFLFFTDFHDALAEAVREGRRGEFAKFEAFADEAARSRIPDPNAHETFERSQPKQGPDSEAWQALYRRLLCLRRERLVPHLPDAVSLDAKVIGPAAVEARWRLGDGAVLHIAINLGDEAVQPRMRGDEPFFTLGEPGTPASFAAWLA